MSADNPSGKLLSILDSAIILAMFSAVCYVMGHAALIGTARRLRLPLFLMPAIGPETIILTGGRYLVLFGALSLLLYFFWILVGRRVGFLEAKLRPLWLRIGLRAKQHPHVYLLLLFIAGGAIVYIVPLLLPLTPRLASGRSSVEVVALQLKAPDASLAGRSFRYLWPQEGVVILEDKANGELVVIRDDEIKLMILTRSY